MVVKKTLAAGVLVAVAAMLHAIQHADLLPANEVALKNNLFTLRTVIDNYTRDKLKAPQSLQELVSAGYLREIPYDPMTRSNQTWKTVMEDASQSLNPDKPGIFDVLSGSRKIGSDGSPYSEW